MRINQNIAAFNAYRNLNQTQSSLNSSLEKLSSGFRINRAADDAAGLVNSENLRAQIGGLKVATRNAQDAISLVQTAEGAMTEVHSILQRMRDLSVQSANAGSNDAASLDANQAEIDQLKEELTRIATQTQFGTKPILSGERTTHTNTDTAGVGSLGEGTFADSAAFRAAVHAAYGAELGTASGDEVTNDMLREVKVTLTDGVDTESSLYDVFFNAAGDFDATASLAEGDVLSVPSGGAQTFTFQVGANANQTASVIIEGVSASALGVSGLDVTVDAADAISKLDAAITSVSGNRAELGAFQNRMESTIRNVSVAVENLSAAESRIRDTDMAQEMVSFTRSQILQQAGTAMLAQANQVPQSVLSLLR